MDLRRLRYAIALAEELNFVRAAEKLHVSQPALSRGIQVLEEELGLVLFDRGSRAVNVTSAGARFLEHARRIVYQMRTFELDMAQLRGGVIGHVAFGAGPTPSHALLPLALRDLRRQRPDLCYSVDTSNAPYLLLHLRSEAIEFFVADARAMAQESDISILPLCRQHGAFVCRPGHPLLGKDNLRLKDMAPYGFALGTWTSPMLAQFLAMLELPPGQTLPVIMESDNISLLTRLAMHDDAIMAVARAAVADELEAGTLSALPLPEARLLFAEINIVHLKGRTLSPAAAIVIEALHAAAARAPDTIMSDGAA